MGDDGVAEGEDDVEMRETCGGRRGVVLQARRLAVLAALVAEGVLDAHLVKIRRWILRVNGTQHCGSI